MWLGLILISLGVVIYQIGKRNMGVLWRFFGIVCVIFLPIDIFSWVYEGNKTGAWVWGKVAAGFHLIVDVFLICITLSAAIFINKKRSDQWDQINKERVIGLVSLTITMILVFGILQLIDFERAY